MELGLDFLSLSLCVRAFLARTISDVFLSSRETKLQRSRPRQNKVNPHTQTHTNILSCPLEGVQRMMPSASCLLVHSHCQWERIEKIPPIIRTAELIELLTLLPTRSSFFTVKKCMDSEALFTDYTRSIPFQRASIKPNDARGGFALHAG